MNHPTRSRAALALAACLSLGGCAIPTGWFAFAPAPIFPGKALSALRAAEAVVPGRSSKADVLAALGKARVIRFESGFEVWVYRGSAPDSVVPGNTEFVILFGPEGIARKTRVRRPTPSDEE